MSIMMPSNLWSEVTSLTTFRIASQQLLSPIFGTGMICSGTFAELDGALKSRLFASIASDVILGILEALFYGCAAAFESSD